MTDLINGFTAQQHLDLAQQGADIAAEFFRLGKADDAAESMRYARWHLDQVRKQPEFLQ